jgi:hypothetical protein
MATTGLRRGVHKALGLELPVALTVVVNGDMPAMDRPG